jgi:hypothetical protein
MVTVTPEAPRAESVLTTDYPARDLPAEAATLATITRIYEGTNQIQRMVMARSSSRGDRLGTSTSPEREAGRAG